MIRLFLAIMISFSDIESNKVLWKDKIWYIKATTTIKTSINEKKYSLCSTGFDSRAEAAKEYVLDHKYKTILADKDKL